MEYHIEQIPYNTKIKRIYHISDIHINLQAKHDEYRQVFSNLFDFLKSEKEKYNITDNKNSDSVIVITGDILHSKTELLPECIELTRYFLSNLAKIMTTIMIAGNHDLNINNKERLDGLTPIKNGVDKDLPLYYFKKSGLYYFGNIIWSLASVQDYLIINPETIKGENKTKICLFHGRVNGAILYNKTKIDGEINKKNNKTITPECFKGYDFALLGDIHKHQYINKEKTMAYSGSLIQQNHGETRKGHGVLLWNIDDKTSNFYPIKNNYCFYTHTIKNNTFTQEELEDINVPNNMRLRLLLKNTNASKIQEIIALFKSKFNILEVSYQDVSQKKDSDIKASVTNSITNVEYQNKLIEEYLIRYKDVTQNTIDYIKKLNHLSNKQLDLNNRYSCSRWKLIKLEFSNLFSYSEDNVIQFKNYKGILGIIAPNHMGKSAIIDIILFTLYDKFPRKGTIKDIVNNRKNNFKSKIMFKIGGWRYVVFKYGNKTDKGRVTTKVDFYRINKENIKEILTEENVVKTKTAILKYVGMYEDLIQTNISLQNNNCNFIEAENTARRKELERILQVDFINELVKKNNTIIIEKRAIYKHLQNNCYEESILKLKKNITETVQNINENDKKLKFVENEIKIIENTLNDLTEIYNPQLEEQFNTDFNSISNYDKPIEKLNGILSKLKKEKTMLLKNNINSNNKKKYDSLSELSFDNLQDEKVKQEEKHNNYLSNKDKEIQDLDLKIETIYSQKKLIQSDKNIDIKALENNITLISDKIVFISNISDDLSKEEDKNKQLLKLESQLNHQLNKINEQNLPQDMITYLEETPILELEEKTAKSEKEFLDNKVNNKRLQKYKDNLKDYHNYKYLEDYQTNFEDQMNVKNNIETELKKVKANIQKSETILIHIQGKFYEYLKEFMNGNEIEIENDIELSNIKITNYNSKSHNISKTNSDLNIVIIKLRNILEKQKTKIIEHKEDQEKIKSNSLLDKKLTLMKEDKKNLINKRNSDKDYIQFITILNLIDKIGDIERRISTTSNKITEIKDKQKQFEKYKSDIIKNNEIKVKIDSYKVELKEKKEFFKNLDYQLNITKTEFVKNNTKLNEHKLEIKKMKDIEKELNIYVIYNDSLKQLPYIVIKKVITNLETKINEFLCVCTNFMIKIEVDNNRIDIYIDRPVYNGSLILLNNASGFERFISSLAIRLALINISQLPKPNFIAIDEGWTSFDYQNINNVRLIFDHIIKEFDFVLSISHLSQIKEHCNHQIHLKKNKDGYSKIII